MKRLKVSGSMGVVVILCGVVVILCGVVVILCGVVVILCGVSAFTLKRNSYVKTCLNTE